MLAARSRVKCTTLPRRLGFNLVTEALHSISQWGVGMLDYLERDIGTIPLPLLTEVNDEF